MGLSGGQSENLAYIAAMLTELHRLAYQSGLTALAVEIGQAGLVASEIADGERPPSLRPPRPQAKQGETLGG